ncbi:MAG: NINE protein [Limisphaerales bacterium]
MYWILGTDGKEYGPVSVEQVRAWLGDNRASSSTLARVEGSSEWKPLGSYADFSFGVPPLLDQRKSRLLAGLFGVLLGGIGLHRFYLGYIGVGLAQIVVTVVTCGLGWIWGFIEGILILTGSNITTDASGQPLKH